uniref:PCI domain-containing protein n=1 Tax=Strigamia maritima TaxID=126957 RepID=T1IJC1_STRMM
MPNVAELAEGPYAKYFNLLNLFAYGTYSDYLANQANLPELTPPQIQKLRHLTIVSLATKTKCIPYSTLLKELDMKNLRELEDLIIEVIYADIVHGKLDQKHSQLEVDYTIGRDIRPEDVPNIVSVLTDWCDSCETILSNVESQINKANTNKDSRNKHKTLLEQEVSNIRKILKNQAQDVEEQMATDTREVGAQPEKLIKNSPKLKEKRQKENGKLCSIHLIINPSYYYSNATWKWQILVKIIMNCQVNHALKNI